MLRRFSVNFAILSMGLDLSFTLLAFFLAGFIRPFLLVSPLVKEYMAIGLPWFLYLFVPFLWLFTFLLVSVYDPKRVYRLVDELQSVALASTLAALLLAGLLYLFFRELSRWLFVIFLMLDLFFLMGWRVLARLLYKVRSLPAVERRVLIVGAGEMGQRVGQMIKDHHWMGLEVVGCLDDERVRQESTVPVLGRFQDVWKIVSEYNVDEVVIALPQRAYNQMNQLVLDLHKLPVRVRVVPDYFSLALYKATAEDFGGVPMINLREPALNAYQRLLKRLVDLCFAFIFLVVVSPFLGLIAILIRLDSPGPVLFRQQRVGENGRLFKMYKFRSMVVGAEQKERQVGRVNGNGEQVYKLPDDPRTTRVGRFLRRTSLDELPQLLNVLLGDMSLVGPRPELPWLVEKYEPWQRGRFAVPPGITGWWQINGRSDKPLHLHTEDDLFYVHNYSLMMDLYILMKTPLVVLRGKGAY